MDILHEKTIIIGRLSVKETRLNLKNNTRKKILLKITNWICYKLRNILLVILRMVYYTYYIIRSKHILLRLFWWKLGILNIPLNISSEWPWLLIIIKFIE